MAGVVEEDLGALNRRGEAGVTVGRTVHYVTAHPNAPQLYPAIVVAVRGDGTATLRIMHADGTFTMDRVAHGAAYKRGCWSWPPRD